MKNIFLSVAIICNVHYRLWHFLNGISLFEIFRYGISHIETKGVSLWVWPEDKLKVGDTITLERAKKIFVKDQQKMIDAIHRKVKIPLHQQEYDAIFSVTFHAGEGGSLDTLAKELNKGKYDKMPEFIKTFKAASTPLRRVREANIWEKGIYDASH